MPKKPLVSNSEFLARVREYLSPDGKLRQLDAHGNPGRDVFPEALQEHTFYCLSSEVVCALSHAIQDVALEEANGRLLGTFQEFNNFESDRERFCHLATTIDGVEIIGAGQQPRPLHRVKFLKDGRAACHGFWVVLYEGRRVGVLLLCRQANEAVAWEEREFIGTYSFDRALIARVRDEVTALVQGTGTGLHEYDRLLAIDLAVKQFEVAFNETRTATEAALRKLQRDSSYPIGDFTEDLRKGLACLEHWQHQVSNALEQPERFPK